MNTEKAIELIVKNNELANEYFVMYPIDRNKRDVLIQQIIANNNQSLTLLAEKQPKATEFTEHLTDIINKHFDIICHSDDGITARDIRDSLFKARETLDRQAAEIERLKKALQAAAINLYKL